MFLFFSHLPPKLVAITILLAHLAVLVDVCVRADLPWWRRLVTAVLIGALLPLGALAYLLLRPVGGWMRQRIARRQALIRAKGRPAPTGWRRVALRAADITGIAVALVASIVASAAADPTSPSVPSPSASTAFPASPFGGRDYGVGLLNLPAAWQASTGRGVTVAVVDSGVDATNPYLAPRLVPGQDLADKTGSIKDGLGHGTHVAGIIAQAAPDARIMPVKVLNAQGGASTATIAAGVRWAADHGAAVINLSVDESGLLAQIQKEGSLNSAAKYAVAKGAVVISAAGNEHSHLQVYKAGVPVITVAAVDSDRQPASFTNWGGPSEVAAPGVEVWSTAPQYPTTLWPDGTAGEGTLDGTSMATPFVSGVAAVIRAHHASAGATQAALLRTAQSVAGTSILGHGVVDAAAALSYAAAHPNPRVGLDFAPRWFRWTQLILVVAVAVKYGIVLVLWLRRRRRQPALAGAA